MNPQLTCRLCNGTSLRYSVIYEQVGDTNYEYGGETLPCRACNPEEHATSYQIALHKAKCGRNRQQNYNPLPCGCYSK